MPAGQAMQQTQSSGIRHVPVLYLSHNSAAGFAANMAVLTAFAASPDCAIFSDALNHASIVDGTRLAARSGAEVSIYRQA